MDINRVSKVFAFVLLLVCAGAQASESVRSSPPGATQFSDATLCVAALEQEVKSSLHLSPTSQQREMWQSRLESAFAHIGDVYLDGLSADDGKALLQSAESDVKNWSPRRLEPFARGCEHKGHELLGKSSVFQKIMIRGFAQRLLKRELAKLAQTQIH